jgi:hypothetical protein
LFIDRYTSVELLARDGRTFSMQWAGLDAMGRLRFNEWFPDERVFPQGTDEDSATLAAIRSVYENLDDATACEHCTPNRAAGRLYYRV